MILSPFCIICFLRTQAYRNREQNQETSEAPTNIPGQADPLTEVTDQANNTGNAEQGKARGNAQPKQRGPPEDGIPSKTKVMVANLPYDLSEDKVRGSALPQFSYVYAIANFTISSRRSFPNTNRSLPRSRCVPFLAS